MRDKRKLLTQTSLQVRSNSFDYRLSNLFSLNYVIIFLNVPNIRYMASTCFPIDAEKRICFLYVDGYGKVAWVGR